MKANIFYLKRDKKNERHSPFKHFKKYFFGLKKILFFCMQPTSLVSLVCLCFYANAPAFTANGRGLHYRRYATRKLIQKFSNEFYPNDSPPYDICEKISIPFEFSV